jgi:hypothetical protein
VNAEDLDTCVNKAFERLRGADLPHDLDATRDLGVLVPELGMLTIIPGKLVVSFLRRVSLLSPDVCTQIEAQRGAGRLPVLVLVGEYGRIISLDFSMSRTRPGAA